MLTENAAPSVSEAPGSADLCRWNSGKKYQQYRVAST
jgi:hypothetical protein